MTDLTVWFTRQEDVENVLADGEGSRLGIYAADLEDEIALIETLGAIGEDAHRADEYVVGVLKPLEPSDLCAPIIHGPGIFN